MNEHERAYPSHGTMGEIVERGMTLRDYFAAKAMQATAGEDGWPNVELIAAWSYKVADAMLKERAA